MLNDLQRLCERLVALGLPPVRATGERERQTWELDFRGALNDLVETARDHVARADRVPAFPDKGSERFQQDWEAQNTAFQACIRSGETLAAIANRVCDLAQRIDLQAMNSPPPVYSGDVAAIIRQKRAKEEEEARLEQQRQSAIAAAWPLVQAWQNLMGTLYKNRHLMAQASPPEEEQVRGREDIATSGIALCREVRRTNWSHKLTEADPVTELAKVAQEIYKLMGLWGGEDSKGLLALLTDVAGMPELDRRNVWNLVEGWAERIVEPGTAWVVQRQCAPKPEPPVCAAAPQSPEEAGGGGRVAALASALLSDLEGFSAHLDVIEGVSPKDVDVPDLIARLRRLWGRLPPGAVPPPEPTGPDLTVAHARNYVLEMQEKLHSLAGHGGSQSSVSELEPAGVEVGAGGAEGDTGAEDGSAAGEQPAANGGTPANQEKIDRLPKRLRRAYRAFLYVALKMGKSLKDLKDQEAYDWLQEDGVPEIGELADYKLPTNAETWRTYLNDARKALGEQKYQSRKGRQHGGSIVKESQIERRVADD
jgi:hypothetical protein